MFLLQIANVLPYGSKYLDWNAKPAYIPVREHGMARARSSKRKPSEEVGRKGSDRTVGEALAPAHTPLLTTSIQLSELGKALPRINLSPLSSLGGRFTHIYPAPLLGKTSPFSPSPPATTMTSVETLGALVRAYREEFALSQQSFAEQAGVGRRFISELENGKPSLEFDKVLAVARAAGIDLLAVRRASSTP